MNLVAVVRIELLVVFFTLASHSVHGVHHVLLRDAGLIVGALVLALLGFLVLNGIGSVNLVKELFVVLVLVFFLLD